MRDGFHLKTRNHELMATLDDRMRPLDDPLASSNQREDEAASKSLGPSKGDVVHQLSVDDELAKPTRVVDTEITAIFDLLQRPTPELSVGNNTTERRSSPADATLSDPCTKPSLTSAYTAAEATAIMARLNPSSDWLIYRHRPNVTPRRQEQEMERMVAEVLDPKQDELLKPTKAMNEQMARKKWAVYRRHNHHPPILPTLRSDLQTDGRRRAQPATLNHVAAPQSIERLRHNQDDAYATAPLIRFATRRSVLQHKTALPLKMDKLLDRVAEFRSLPEVVDGVLREQQAKRQERIQEYGEDLVEKNKQQYQHMRPLQRPSHTPIFPSLVERKHYNAAQRKHDFDEKQFDLLRSTVNRWQKRRDEQQESIRRHYHQSQWILIVALARASGAWMTQFRDFKARRDFLFNVVMVRKIQRYWRQKQQLRRHAASALTLPSTSSIRIQFYRMPVVMRAIHLVQASMRAWLKRKQDTQNQQAVEIIITSWFEFQDVKFRRLILRFRKRVRDFQVMWRAWRAITDSRIKLLLLLWVKVEKKYKRRAGIASGGGSRGDNSPGKRTETIHRHLRNGGVVLTSISSTAPIQPSSPRHSPKKKPTSPHSRTRQHNLELQQFIQHDLHHAMGEVYAAGDRSVHHPSQSQSTSILPGSSFSSPGRHLSSPNAKNSSASTSTLPWKPHQPQEKIPLSLKVSLLRNLISEKRRVFRATKDRKRAEWRQRRQQMRKVDFRYTVLDELAAYQRFETQYSVFLLLRSVTDVDILHLMHQASEQVNGRRSRSNSRHNLDGYDTVSPLRESHRPLTTLRPFTPLAPESRSNSIAHEYEHSNDAQRRSTLMIIHPVSFNN
ncbi:hypothetical protein Poli38472_014425 [Pythium oligandrum]|uniref:Uncharacterized protein n=1 Tax=Pythium oligandrum TaxID=41045 RepID=A0A8K1C8A6_PYTOL|nr:hypothetical protein Poli38472_014425 [Pythium oligandrum]|eukprot:TMW57822.1 hypothetical protein Poli38472_014425 [Pythium oligandrum]